ncbi:MAG: tyrosine-type recombinase/integrase [Ignavibacteriales bacterium]
MAVFKRYRKQKDGSKVPYWYIRYWVNSEEKWEAVGKVGEVTKAVAQKALEERKRLVRLGQWDMIGADIPILKDFSKEYLSYTKYTLRKRSWRQDEISIGHLIRFFGEHKLSSITAKDIIAFQTLRLKDGARPATVNRELACLKNLMNVAKQKGNFFGDNPVSKVKFLEENNQRERVLTLEEEERLIANSAPHLRPIILTAIHTGMRKGELLSLKWASVDLENNVITIEPTNTKSKKLKRIPVNSKLRKVLLEQKLKTGFSDYVFLNPLGEPYTRPYSLTTCFKNACRRAGIQGFRFHDLRHTAATRMVETGANIGAIKKILGHADINITMRYAHPEDSLREAVEGIANFSQDRSQVKMEE